MQTKLKLTLPLLIFALISCSRSPEPNFFVLNPIKLLTHSNSGKIWRIGIDPLETPPYIQKPQLALRLANHQINYDEYNRWAEQIDKNIARVIEANLRSMLKNSIVETSPWPSGFRPNYRLQINIVRFEAKSQGYSVLEASYQLVDRSGEKTFTKQTVSYKRRLTNLAPQNIVASMNTNLTALSRHIARHIKN